MGRLNGRAELTVREAGRMGGELVRERHGREHFQRIGEKGGAATLARHGPAFFASIGRLGGRSLKRKYGRGHFERIGAKGGAKVAELIAIAKAQTR